MFEWLQISWNPNEPIQNQANGVIYAFRILSHKFWTFFKL
jgi:hypothetical protein